MAGDTLSVLQMTELDSIRLAEMAQRIALAEEEGLTGRPRHYPGYPTWPLPRAKPRWRPSLDATLAARRSCRSLETALPDTRTLGQLLLLAHRAMDELFRGPVPSAGGLQALELYLVHWQTGWLPAGIYHYDRCAHELAQIVTAADETAWRDRVPSLAQVTGGALLWLVIGDTRLVIQKYGERGERFLLLEAGHLMQNLCLISASLGLCTVPLGGFLERAIERELQLPEYDRVLYVGLCGKPVKT
jgi:SagB-type dehydrogenase family enzyme